MLHVAPEGSDFAWFNEQSTGGIWFEGLKTGECRDFTKLCMMGPRRAQGWAYAEEFVGIETWLFQGIILLSSTYPCKEEIHPRDGNR